MKHLAVLPSTLLAASGAAALAGAPPQDLRPAPRPPLMHAGTLQIDPCRVASAALLKQVLQAGLPQLVPPDINQAGKHLNFSDPSILNVACPNLNFKIQLNVQYRETRGIPQFQTGGTLTIDSGVITNLSYTSATGNSTISAANLTSAIAVLTNPQITSLKIDRLPGWLDPPWIRECLNGQHADWGCKSVFTTTHFNITQYVMLYLAQGNTL